MARVTPVVMKVATGGLWLAEGTAMFEIVFAVVYAAVGIAAVIRFHVVCKREWEGVRDHDYSTAASRKHR